MDFLTYLAGTCAFLAGICTVLCDERIYAALSEEEIPYGLVAALVCQKIVKTKDYSQPIIKKYLDEYVRYRDRIARVMAAEEARQTA